MQHDPYNSYSFLLERTAKRVKHYAQSKFRAEGFNITVDQWVVLCRLSRDKGRKQNEIAEEIGKDNPTLTRIIDLLCEKNLTERIVNPDDRRSFLVQLTDIGQEKVEMLAPKIQEIRLDAWQGLTDKDFSHFQKVLNTIYKNLELS